MARIVVTSDLHLGITTTDELHALAERIAAEQPDLTVLAGDIGEGLPNVRDCLRIFAGLPGDVAVLMGNHDLWMHGNDSQRLWEELLPQAARDTGILWLEESVWRDGEIAVAGSMAWYDYSAVDPAVPPMPTEWFAEFKGQYNPDAKFINWPWSDVEMARRLGDELLARLDELEQGASVQAVLVVTHVPLYRPQMLYKAGDQRWGTGNAYFGNMTLGQRILPLPKVRRVISGHTHIGREGTVDRPNMPPLPVSVVNSDYHRPVYLIVESSDLLV